MLTQSNHDGTEQDACQGDIPPHADIVATYVAPVIKLLLPDARSIWRSLPCPSIVTVLSLPSIESAQEDLLYHSLEEEAREQHFGLLLVQLESQFQGGAEAAWLEQMFTSGSIPFIAEVRRSY